MSITPIVSAIYVLQKRYSWDISRDPDGNGRYARNYVPLFILQGIMRIFEWTNLTRS
jgi:hypothetical protein